MIRPLRDKIVVRPINRIKSHVLEVVMQEHPNIGEVMAVGPGEVDRKGRLHPNPCEIGQIVRYGTSGEYLTFPKVDVDGTEMIVLSWKDVVFVEEGHAQDHQ